ncbi:MAG: type secretion system protein GspN [Myxococcaceae bacterium]|nr:type secretion system protein GspN [Myxococcaceae bacterium]
MAEEKKLSLWKRIAGYSAFSVFALITAFFLTFPYETLKERVRLEADAQGYVVKIGSLGPGFFSLRATDVKISAKSTGAAEEAPPQALQIDAISVGPALFPPGVAISARAFGGSVVAKAGMLKDVSVKLEAEDIDLSKGNLKGFTGIDFGGTIDLSAALAMPQVKVGGGPAEPDLGAATGNLVLETHGVAINGGTANVVIPMYGAEPTPLDLPKIVLGDITGKLKFEKGAGTIEEFRGKSADLEVGITGTIKLAKALAYSEPNLEVRFKPDSEFQKRLGLVGSALSAVGSDPKDPSWRLGRLTGFLGKPNFR